MLTESTVVPPSTSMDREEEDTAELLSDSLFHSCMSSFDENKTDLGVAGDEEIQVEEEEIFVS